MICISQEYSFFFFLIHYRLFFFFFFFATALVRFALSDQDCQIIGPETFPGFKASMQTLQMNKGGNSLRNYHSTLSYPRPFDHTYHKHVALSQSLLWLKTMDNVQYHYAMKK